MRVALLYISRLLQLLLVFDVFDGGGQIIFQLDVIFCGLHTSFFFSIVEYHILLIFAKFLLSYLKSILLL